MSTPTLKELIEKATPGPWRTVKAVHGTLTDCEQMVPLIAAIQGERGPDVCRFINGRDFAANAQLIARCNPATMAKVLYVLEILQDMIPSPEVTEALNALNGKAP